MKRFVLWRLPCNAVLESLIGMSDDFSQVEHDNWEYRSLKTEELDATTEMLKTRQRVFRILTETKAGISEILHQKLPLPLKDVINGIQEDIVQEYWY